ncbi:hypothetical protein SERLADRAFT_412244 [Serpula lacrymans var. lacrymans S7.9]|uniref:Uncharacterized protein n=1 Tax=Serpula lacrymans var. lacrymans (strain S7.9) TaxID=578457 RepID=F8PEM5_SERL9|nr:uncharacterized protein SERLADRAFT_412244 [Serpula lacrymans var. lacrymans S7.9]EGO18421.1 hypothetical protein SERLADRAFT_412244 [Serpula lacrymans var. lacrymans S7.9]
MGQVHPQQCRKTGDMLEAEVGDADQSNNKGDEEEDEEPIYNYTPPATPTSSRSPAHNEVLMSSFSLTSAKLAKSGHSRLRVLLATSKSFLSFEEHDNLVWAALKEVGNFSTTLSAKLLKLENVENG